MQSIDQGSSQYIERYQHVSTLPQTDRRRHEWDARITSLRTMMTYMPYSDYVLDYLTQSTHNTIPQNAQLDTSMRTIASATPPPLREFIAHLSRRVNIPILTMLSTTVYLDRLRFKLESTKKVLSCTAHRIFLSVLIVAAKYLNDNSPRNHMWAEYSIMRLNRRLFWFSLEEIGVMERQTLFLLEWKLAVGEVDVYQRSTPYHTNVRTAWDQNFEKACQADIQWAMRNLFPDDICLNSFTYGCRQNEMKVVRILRLKAAVWLSGCEV